MRRWVTHSLVVAVCFVPLAMLPADANAGFGVDRGSLQTSLSTPIAGARPDLTASFRLNQSAPDTPDGSIRDLDVDLPPGLVGNPTAAGPSCTQGDVGSNQCPASAAVGYVRAATGPAGSPPSENISLLYRIEPSDDSPASFAFQILSLRGRLNARVRSDGDYGLRASIQALTQQVRIHSLGFTLFGVPDDHLGPGGLTTFQGVNFGGPNGPGPRRSFLSNPTSCPGGPISIGLGVRAWENGASDYASNPLGSIIGCESLRFAPTLDVRPQTSAPGAPSGYSIDLSVPQSDSPDGRATPTLDDASVTLPPGLTISPSAANGLAGCSSTQFARSALGPPACPGASRVGSVSVSTPLLEQRLTGGIYIGQPEAGNRYRLFLSASGSGVDIKLEGRVEPDPATGQLRATFTDNPQLPFDNLHLDFEGGSNAVLANPTTCGQQTATATLASHAGQAVTPSASFDIACPGVSGFAPTFTAGSSTSAAGDFSPLRAQFGRDDSSQFFSGVSVTLPTGVLARLRGVPVCAPGAAQAGACPAASRVGTATVAAGPGSSPYSLQGSVSLGGSYKGAPYSLVVAVRAIAGPYDLGTVVVRQALYVNRRSARITAVSDPLPTILGGVPLRLRSVDIAIDRPDFAVNPTSCAEKSVGGVLTGVSGGRSSQSVRYRATACRDLDLEPKLALRLSGSRSAFRDGGHPALKAILTQPRGQANLKNVSVKLPSSLALDPDNANGLCSYEESIKDEPNCPKSSVVGRARAITPLLGSPLRGPVYFAKNVRVNRFGRRVATLPTLVIPLRGAIALNLRATSAVRSGKFLVTRFSGIPDAPISRFDLRLNGGGSGILVANTRLCNQSRSIGLAVDGQNGKLADTEPRIAAKVCDSSKRARR